MLCERIYFSFSKMQIFCFCFLQCSLNLAAIRQTIRLASPCDGCEAPYGYRNHMPLSTDTAEFSVRQSTATFALSIHCSLSLSHFVLFLASNHGIWIAHMPLGLFHIALDVRIDVVVVSFRHTHTHCIRCLRVVGHFYLQDAFCCPKTYYPLCLFTVLV